MGTAWQCLARRGEARKGEAGQALAGRNLARLGTDGRGAAGRCGARRGSQSGGRLKQIEIEITGVTPLLVHRFGEEAEQGKETRRIMVEKRDPRVEATKAAYIAKDGTFYFSAFSIPNAMAAAGSSHKMKGSRKTLRFVVPSAIRMAGDAITICNGSGKPAKDFEVDSRPVTIPSTKGRIMRHRPRFDQWSASFTMMVNDDLLAPETAHQLLNEAGMTIGVGDFRPEKRGPFGTFRVTKFEEA